MEIAVREGRASDIQPIMKMIKELASFEKYPVRNSARQMLKDRDFFGSFVAERDGELVGYAIYFFAYYTFAGRSLYLDDIYVKPKYRGRKIGAMLMHEVFKLAKKRGCKRLRLQVLDWNKNAMGFYKRYGGKVSKEWLNCDFDGRDIDRFLRVR